MGALENHLNRQEAIMPSFSIPARAPLSDTERAVVLKRLRRRQQIVIFIDLVWLAMALMAVGLTVALVMLQALANGPIGLVQLSPLILTLPYILSGAITRLVFGRALNRDHGLLRFGKVVPSDEDQDDAHEPSNHEEDSRPRCDDETPSNRWKDMLRVMAARPTDDPEWSPTEKRAYRKIVQAQARFLTHGTPQELMERDVMADRVPLCFKRHCYATTLSPRTVRVVEALEPQHATMNAIESIAKYAPVSLAAYYRPLAAYGDWENYFEKGEAASQIVFEHLEGASKSMSLRPSLRAQVEDAIERIADPEFELDRFWYASDERRTFALMAPHVLARLEDEVDEARIYEMLQTP